MQKIHLKSNWFDNELGFYYQHFIHIRDLYKHVHDHDFFEFFIITEGQISHIINKDTSVLKKGDIVFIRPQDTHGFEQYKNKDCSLLNIVFLSTTMFELARFLGKSFDFNGFLAQRSPPTFTLTPTNFTLLINTIEKLHLVNIKDKKRKSAELKVLLINLFFEYFIQQKSENVDLLPDWLEKLITEMKQPVNFIAGHERLKEIACKSDEHISRSFKKYLGKTPTHFVNELKLNYAANLIQHTNKNIADIAFESGFENLSNFYKQFERIFKCTPNSFRGRGLSN